MAVWRLHSTSSTWNQVRYWLVWLLVIRSVMVWPAYGGEARSEGPPRLRAARGGHAGAMVAVRVRVPAVVLPVAGAIVCRLLRPEVRAEWQRHVVAGGRPDQLRGRRGDDRDPEVVVVRAAVRAAVPALGPVANHQVAGRACGGDADRLRQRDRREARRTRLVRRARAHQVREAAGERRPIGRDRRRTVADRRAVRRDRRRLARPHLRIEAGGRRHGPPSGRRGPRRTDFEVAVDGRLRVRGLGAVRRDVEVEPVGLDAGVLGQEAQLAAVVGSGVGRAGVDAIGPLLGRDQGRAVAAGEARRVHVERAADP